MEGPPPGAEGRENDRRTRRDGFSSRRTRREPQTSRGAKGCRQPDVI